MHWASQYIGRLWGVPGSGLSCWEFARHVLTTHYGATVPADPSEALQVHDWHRVPAGAHMQDGDVLLLRGASQLHAGIVVEPRPGDLRLLHANGTLRAGLPVGQVVAEPLEDAVVAYLRVEAWRRDAQA